MTDTISSTREACLVSVSMTYSSSQYLCLSFFFYSFCSLIMFFTLFHVSVPLCSTVAYNICMYIMCPWSRKVTKKRRRKHKNKHGQKKIRHGHVSQCVFEKKHVNVCVWVDFEKKKKRKQANIVCCVQVHGQRIQLKRYLGDVTWNHRLVINKTWAFVQTNSKKQVFHESCMWMRHSYGVREEGWRGCRQIPVGTQLDG